MSKTVKTILACTLTASLIGCSSKAGTGAVVGGLGGAAVGGLIGSKSHARAGEGALIGGAVGAIGGALVGHGMDKADERKKEEAEDHRYRDRSYSQNSYSQSSYSRSGTITCGDVEDWSRQGVKDEVIIDRIQRSGQTFAVTAADEREMSNASVSPSVIRAMKETSR